jgi:hypothetical protein
MQKLNSVLVEYLQMGFDFYDPLACKLEFVFAKERERAKETSKNNAKNREQFESHEIYNIYQVLNSQSVQ